MTNDTMDMVDLLNDLNEAVGHPPRTTDCVMAAATMLLVSALRQIGGAHGLERAREIGGELEKMVGSEDEAMKKFFKVTSADA